MMKLFKKKHKGPKQVKVGNYTLWANNEHPIQGYLENHKYYSRNLPRIAKYLEIKYPEYSIIDVGANIGDTIALLRSTNVNQLVHMIEGEPGYYGFLQQNLPQFTKAKTYQQFLGEKTEVKAGGFQSAEGTGRLSNDKSQSISLKQLDELAAEEQFEKVKLLKIDTDGFDFSILRGSFGLLKQHKPVLFLEYDAVFMEEQSEYRNQTLHQIEELGYHKIIFYDNFGRMVISTTLGQHQQLEQLYIYMRRREGAFPYFDICIFHRDDDHLADEVIQKEMDYYNEY